MMHSPQKMPTFNRTYLYLLLLFLAELGVITFARANINPYLTPLLLLIFPIAFGALALQQGKPLDYLPLTFPAYLLIGMWVAALILIGFIFATTPISLPLSDTIPIMLSAVKKLTAGEFPYTPVDEGWGYTAFCTYMPMHWLPLVLPHLLGIEVRWVGVLVFLGVNIAYCYTQVKTWKVPLPPFSPPLFLLIIPLHDLHSLGQTMELMIVAYYMLLVFALFSGKMGWQILAISLCLLSRYSLLIWLPLWVGLMFFYDSKRKALTLTGGIVFCILIGYILPFWIKDTSIFSQALEYYSTSSGRLWQMMGEWQKAGDTPFILRGGGSLAIYFYHFLGGDIPHKLLFLKYTQLIMSSLFIGTAFVAYPFFRKKISYQLYAIYCLPIYLGIFYAFMLVPFMYLQLVPCGVMMALLISRRFSQI